MPRVVYEEEEVFLTTSDVKDTYSITNIARMIALLIKHSRIAELDGLTEGEKFIKEKILDLYKIIGRE